MANEIVKAVASKAKIAEPIAQIAVDTVVRMLKDKLPANVGGLLDTFMGSSKTSTTNANNPLGNLGNLGNIAGTLGGLLGGKK